MYYSCCRHVWHESVTAWASNYLFCGLRGELSANFTFWHEPTRDWSTYEPAHEKRGLTAFSVILGKSQSKIVVQNFSISQVCDLVFESYDAAHARPCFVEVVKRKLKCSRESWSVQEKAEVSSILLQFTWNEIGWMFAKLRQVEDKEVVCGAAVFSLFLFLKFILFCLLGE